MEQSITLRANDSGRRWGVDPARWHVLSSPDGCRMCGRDPGGRGALIETAGCWISIRPEAPLPGYVCVISKVHVVEPYELDEDQQVRFWLDCMAVAKGLAELLAPAKMNYEIHGNTDPHLHMHLFPRSAHDVYVGYPNHCRVTFERSPDDVLKLADAIRTSLGPRAL
jgi:diadenosine tetraphosphate (Ap4A) HIT family hydrolase